MADPVTDIEHGPSSAGRWAGGRCTASVALRAKYPRESGEAAARGNRLHAVAERMLLGTPDPSGVTPDERDALQVYVDTVHGAAAEGGGVVDIEQSIAWDENPALHGTPDAVILRGEHVHVVDLKTGMSPVDARHNWQLLIYAIMCTPPGATAELTIVQPWAYHSSGQKVRTWNVDAASLDHYRQQLRLYVHDITTGQTQYVTGPHCRYCEALHACPAAAEMTLHAVASAEQAPRELPPEFVARELLAMRDTAQLLAYRIAALETEIRDAHERGQPTPHTQLTRGRKGKLVWRDAAQAVHLLTLLTGEDPRELRLPTPKQVVDSGVDEAKVMLAASRTASKANIVVDMNNKKLSAAFGALPNQPSSESEQTKT